MWAARSSKEQFLHSLFIHVFSFPVSLISVLPCFLSEGRCTRLQMVKSCSTSWMECGAWGDVRSEKYTLCHPTSGADFSVSWTARVCPPHVLCRSRHHHHKALGRGMQMRNTPYSSKNGHNLGYLRKATLAYMLRLPPCLTRASQPARSSPSQLRGARAPLSTFSAHMMWC